MSTKFNRHGRRFIVGLLGTGGLLAALLVPTQAAGADPIIPGSYSVTVAPSSAPAGSTVAYAVTFRNASIPSSLDVMNTASITFPAGYTNVSAPASTSDSNGLPWSVSRSGNTVSLSATLAGVLPGGSVDVAVTATAPTVPGHYTGSSNAGGVVGGTTGTNPFTISGNQPSSDVTPAAAAKLAFVQQPSWAQAGSVITPAIKVAVLDNFGNTVAGPASVTLSAAYNPNTGNPTNPAGLPVSATSVNGLATFSSVAIGDAGYGYRLLATSGTLTPATSNPFDIGTYAAPCPANTRCVSPTIGNPNDTQASAVDEKGTNNDFYTVSLGKQSPPECPTMSGYNGQVVTVTNQDMTRYLTVTLEIDKTVVNANPNNGLSSYKICYSSLIADSQGRRWTTASGQPASISSDGLSYYGYLPGCSSVGNLPPCEVSLKKNGSGDVVGVFKSLPGDPKGMFGIPVL